MTKEINKKPEKELKKLSTKTDSQKISGKQEPTVAKSGKRSAKAIKLKQQEKDKKVKKIDKVTEEKEKKTKKATPKNLEKAHSKAYRSAKKMIDEATPYQLPEAIQVVKNMATAKFDSTVEIHINLGIDTKQADQNIRGSVILPKSLNKEVKVAVLANENISDKLKQAGADLYDSEEILAKLAKSKTDFFDVLLSTPDQMVQLGKFAKVLGPKGLMPSPKSGTVTDDPVKIIKEIKAGRIEFRNDSYGIVHMAIGKKSFEDKDLVLNINTFFSAIKNAKPNNLKNSYIKSIYLTSTMSPSVKVDISSLGTK